MGTMPGRPFSNLFTSASLVFPLQALQAVHLSQAPLQQPEPPLPNRAISRFPGQVIPTRQELLWSGSTRILIHLSSATPQLAAS